MPPAPTPAVLAIALATLACGGDQSEVRDFDPGPTPLAYIPGEAMFNGSCASCHGQLAAGNEKGPPLVHVIYEPSHHGDFAFSRAVELGVVAHHWNFGPMPPVEGLGPDQVNEIVSYVRWLQRQAGIS